ncbi:Hypothetical protein NTJ_00424 [Nesidiocoris tenuis]|uniref:Uncharacterized protein n=1 Tax=Nesidiocoris tenuis TaxID=355587 RepID=A0ABN7A6Q4_9HEMI|nr:Hypothetical protein NTJ_00424 [Nesidiocoris tenuis]
MSSQTGLERHNFAGHHLTCSPSKSIQVTREGSVDPFTRRKEPPTDSELFNGDRQAIRKAIDLWKASCNFDEILSRRALWKINVSGSYEDLGNVLWKAKEM